MLITLLLLEIKQQQQQNILATDSIWLAIMLYFTKATAGNQDMIPQ